MPTYAVMWHELSTQGLTHAHSPGPLKTINAVTFETSNMFVSFGNEASGISISCSHRKKIDLCSLMLLPSGLDAKLFQCVFRHA